MESRDYELILDALPNIGIYVVRQEDRAILYFNQRMRSFAPHIRLGESCTGMWGDLCEACLLKKVEEGRASTTVYSKSFDGTVNITAKEILWENTTPAYVIAVVPHGIENARRESRMVSVLRSRFRMMTTVDLDTGECERMRLGRGSEQDAVMTGEYSSYIERATKEHVHPDDAKAFRDTLSLEHLREKASQTQDYDEEVFTYRQRGEPARWIELRVIYSRHGDKTAVNILGQDVTREKSREESSNRALEERAYIIGSLSSLFFATYYMDLERGTFRTVMQQRNVGDVLGNEVNCTAALQIYANHFIHPDDREEYFEVINVENIAQSLRWWQPSLAVEYRKLLDEPGSDTSSWSWVRATVVLARSGSDDMPKTAIYVAQDIGTGSRHGHSAV